jgi:hypothetical protein
VGTAAPIAVTVLPAVILDVMQHWLREAKWLKNTCTACGWEAEVFSRTLAPKLKPPGTL